jgi:stearoyl-CoA 9-desaturase NADPH oxidoreductase
MNAPWRQSLGPARRPLNGLLRSRLAAALVAPHDVDDYLALVDPTWSVREVRARVVRIDWPTRRTVSLWLAPNELWRGFKAGQYVMLSVRVGGVRHTRCFSISSAPEDGVPLRLTIQVIPDGRISEWVWQQAQIGDVVELSQAQGEFVLPRVVPPALLFVSAGSGITPLMSMMQHLVRVRYPGRVYWLHYARHEVIFADELAELAASEPGLSLFLHTLRRGEASSARRHFSEQQLERAVPTWRECETFVCGPRGLMDSVCSLWRRNGLEQQLHTEYFHAAGSPEPVADAPRCSLVFQRSGERYLGRASGSLLEQAEAAGVHPASGCRMGICRSCVCRKVSGVVRNELTGQISSAPNEDIQLCISTPRSTVVLDL